MNAWLLNTKISITFSLNDNQLRPHRYDLLFPTENESQPILFLRYPIDEFKYEQKKALQQAAIQQLFDLFCLTFFWCCDFLTSTKWKQKQKNK